MFKRNFLLAFALLSFLLQPAFAAEVLKVKGDAILIDTAGDNIKMGSTYYLVTNGKKKGIVKIIKLRPGQALAKLLKGKALPNWVLQKRSVKSKAATTRKAVAKRKKIKAPQPKSVYSKKKKRRRRGRNKEGKLAVGAAIGMNNNSSTVIFTNPARTDEYAGSSSSFELIADYQIYNKFSLRGSLGMQNFSAGGDTSNTQCVDPSTGLTGLVCQIDLGYMNLDLWLRYKAFQAGRFDFWLGAGLGILFSPKFNSTTALNEADLSTNTFMQVGGGADIKLTEKVYMPIWAEYGLFPSSDTVEMNSTSVYFGLAYKL